MREARGGHRVSEREPVTVPALPPRSAAVIGIASVSSYVRVAVVLEPGSAATWVWEPVRWIRQSIRSAVSP